MKKQCYPFKLYKLPYAYDALEPFIDTKTMELHHDRHLKAYTDKLNAALKPYPEFHNRTLEWLLCNVNNLPMKLRCDVRHNAGGVYNHIYYFAGMSPENAMVPIEKGEKDCDDKCNGRVFVGELGEKISRCFGNFDRFKEIFSESAIELFGSGYLWLAADRRGGLKILSTPNQDVPISKGYCPLMTLDLWEHAYYLKHYNDRATYINDWFCVINTDFVEKNYTCCIS